jgi:hypothetical protein
MAQTLEIRPRLDQFKDALIWVVNELGEGDEIVVHEEANPPWFRIVAQKGEAIALEMERRGVDVRRLGVPTDVPFS